jgi:hypothetical protein
MWPYEIIEQLRSGAITDKDCILVDPTLWFDHESANEFYRLIAATEYARLGDTDIVLVEVEAA